MDRMQDIWQAYTNLIIQAVSAYFSSTEHWPDILSLGVLLAVMLAVGLLLPSWASLSLLAAIGLPWAWFVGVLFLASVASESNRTNY